MKRCLLTLLLLCGTSLYSISAFAQVQNDSITLKEEVSNADNSAGELENKDVPALNIIQDSTSEAKKVTESKNNIAVVKTKKSESVSKKSGVTSVNKHKDSKNVKNKQESADSDAAKHDVTSEVAEKDSAVTADTIKSIVVPDSALISSLKDNINKSNNIITGSINEHNTWLIVLSILLLVTLSVCISLFVKLRKVLTESDDVRDNKMSELEAALSALEGLVNNVRTDVVENSKISSSELSDIINALTTRIESIRNDIGVIKTENKDGVMMIQTEHNDKTAEILAQINSCKSNIEELSSFLSSLKDETLSAINASKGSKGADKVAYDSAVDRWINLNNRLAVQGKIRKNIQHVFALLAGLDVSDAELQSDLSNVSDDKKEEVNSIISDIKLFRHQYLSTIESWLKEVPEIGNTLSDVVRFPGNQTFDNNLDEEITGDSVEDGEDIMWVGSLGYIFPGSRNGCYRVKSKVCV